MDPRRILIFRTVVRAGSISAGARALGWTQPAVSQHLRLLEREASTPLLLRRSSGVEPTEAGRALLTQADAIASHLDVAAQQLDDLAQARTGTVRLAAFPSGLAVTVPLALARLAESRPGIDVHLVEAEPPEALELVRAGDVDLALVFGFPRQDDRDDLVRVPLAADELRLVTPADHGPVADVGELRDASWVAGCERCRGHLVEVCRTAGFEPTIRHVTDDYVVVQSLVAMGLAVAVLPQTALTAFRHSDVAVHSLDDLGAREISLVHRGGIDTVPAVAAMVEALTSVAPGRTA